MPYKSAILGCGPRARGHIRAYEHVKRGTITAICDMDEKKLNAIGDEFGIWRRYVNLEEMLSAEAPDLLHIVTSTNYRIDVLRMAAAHGVPAVIIEKPLAVDGEGYRALVEFAAATSMKVCVNHQLHFHPRRRELAKYVEDGMIGEVLLVEGSARANLMVQGTHIMQLIHAFMGGARATHVFGNVAGTANLSFRGHAAPDQCEAVIEFENGRRAFFQCGENAPQVGERGVNDHKRVAVYGTRGFVHWTMWGWERTRRDGTVERGEHAYREEDVLGQASLTEAAFDWLEDDAKVHPTNLRSALAELNVILGIYMSALHHRRVELPVEPENELIKRLSDALSG